MIWFYSLAVLLLMRFCLLVFLFSTGCTARNSPQVRPAPFSFYRDTFAFENELLWHYEVSTNGTLRIQDRTPRPDYFNRCFPLIHSARKFHYHAAFATNGPHLGEEAYKQAVTAVLKGPSRAVSPPENKIKIPGYPDLRSFSTNHEWLLKQECGTLLGSYRQRGNWRIVFPFTRWGQAREAERLREKVSQGELPIVHIVDFPLLNHALLLYDFVQEGGVVYFHCYDPNDSSKPALLLFDLEARRFYIPLNRYYRGGPINVYEVYRNLLF